MTGLGVMTGLASALQGSALKLPDCARHFLPLQANYFLVIPFEAALAQYSFQLLEILQTPYNFGLNAPSVLPGKVTALHSKSWK